MWASPFESTLAPAAWYTTPFATIGATEFPVPSAWLVHSGSQVAAPHPASLNASRRPELLATKARPRLTAGMDATSKPPRSGLVQPSVMVNASSTSRVAVVFPAFHTVTATVPLDIGGSDRAGPDNWVPPRAADWVTNPPYSSYTATLFAPVFVLIETNRRPPPDTAGGPCSQLNPTDQSGVHAFGFPEQLVVPAASNAARVWVPNSPTKTF